jgi:hypothetical protein
MFEELNYLYEMANKLSHNLYSKDGLTAIKLSQTGGEYHNG